MENVAQEGRRPEQGVHDHDRRISVLEAQMEDVRRAGEHREERLTAVERAVLVLTEKIDSLATRLEGLRVTGWKQAMATVVAVLLPIASLFYYAIQLIITHIAQSGGRVP